MEYGVIVAEDETLILKNTVRKIDGLNMGFKVVGTAQTGSQALALVEQLSPRLLITDIRMPVMDGIQLIENVRRVRPGTDCVILSGYSDFDYAQQAIHLGVREYLLKPVEIEKLSALLAQLRGEYGAANAAGKLPELPADEDIAPQNLAETMRAMIDRDYRSDFNLNTVAEQLNYSAGYLARVFTQYCRMTPTRYLITVRMRHACRLLEAPEEYSVRRVGEAVGYPEQGYFSRIFKKYVGVSPQKYRETHTAGQESR